MATNATDEGTQSVQLPVHWQLHWIAPSIRADAAEHAGPADDASKTVLSLELGPIAEFGDSLSVIFQKHGFEPWGLPGAPTGDVLIKIASFPPLDAVWTLYMMIRRASGKAAPPAWEAMCRYSADVRQGLWPDRTPPERAVQSVYLALAQENLLGDEPNREGFIEEALALCAYIERRLEGKARLLDDDLFAEAPAFERYVSLLSADRDLYKEDRARGRSFWAEIPAEHSPTKTARRLPLLVLPLPVARQFKLWARRDPDAPNGSGYPLLLTQLPDNSIILSADPGQRAQVGFLAGGLSKLEARAREKQGREPEAWYDGRNHKHTLCAGPIGGSALSLDEVVGYLKQELRLSPAGKASGKPAGKWIGAAAIAIGMAAAGGIFYSMRSTAPKAPAEMAQAAPGGQNNKNVDQSDEVNTGAKGAKGEPLEKDEVISLLISDEGPKTMRHFALIAGVCGYEGAQQLNSPCRDARAMRDLLIHEYGYAKEDILFLVDKPEAGERADGVPTAETMKAKVERFRNQFDKIENSTFLFYYSGHGGYIQGAQLDFGVLEPSGFFTTLKDLPYEHRGWEMQRLVDDIKKGVPSKHIMVILDACYAGWAGAKGDDEFDERVRSLWKERAEVVLSAGTKGQRAWEDEAEQKAWVWDGHSAMTAFILEGLHVNSEGFAGADRNKDGIVTDEELAGYVRERVPSSVKQLKKATQTPMMFRLDHAYSKSGQFLFVPQRKVRLP